MTSGSRGVLLAPPQVSEISANTSRDAVAKIRYVVMCDMIIVANVYCGETSGALP